MASANNKRRKAGRFVNSRPLSQTIADFRKGKIQCGKYRFAEYEQAKKKRPHMRIYQCPTCDGYHATSKPEWKEEI